MSPSFKNPRKNDVLVVKKNPEKRRPRRLKIPGKTTSSSFNLVDQEVNHPEKRRPRRFLG